MRFYVWSFIDLRHNLWRKVRKRNDRKIWTIPLGQKNKTKQYCHRIIRHMSSHNVQSLDYFCYIHTVSKWWIFLLINIVPSCPTWKLNLKDFNEKHILNKKGKHFIFLRKSVTPFSAWAKTLIFSADLSLEVIKCNF